MNEHDVTAVLERLIEPLEDEVGNWDDVRRRAAEPPTADWDEALEGAEPARDRRPSLEQSRARQGRRPHRRRVLVLAAAGLVVVGATAAFATARGLFSGSARTAFQSPTWSPDGRRISFLRHHWDDNVKRSTDVYVMNADGSGLRKLTDALDPSRDVNPILSPDWRKVAFWRNPCDAVNANCKGNSTIYVVNADGSGKHRLARGGSVWKVNGQRQWGRDGDGLAWSPDGRRIAFMSDRDGNFEIYVVNAHGSQERRLTREPEFDSDPAWSPDGQKIAFVRSIRDRGRLRRQEIHTMNANGTGQLALGRGSRPAWSPDGRRIVFRSDRDGNGEVYVMNADGTGLRRLTHNPASDGDALWSLDGRRIFFVRFQHGKSDVYAMNADGSRQRNLSRNPAPPHDGRDNSPAVSPDGRRIAFVSQRDGTQQIYIMNTDGSGLRRLTHGP